MRARLGWHLVLSLWMNALVVAIAVITLGAGLQIAITKPGHEPTLAMTLELFFGVLPVLPALVILLAGGITISRLQREGSLVSLQAAGRPLRTVGAWILVGAAPFAVAAQLLEAFPVGLAPDQSRLTSSGPTLFEGGGLYFVETRTGSRPPRAAALVFGEERLLLGEAPWGVRSDRQELRLQVQEEWDLSRHGGTVVTAVEPRAWSAKALRAPRSLIWGPEAGPVDVLTLQRWLLLEPWRADLRFARDGKLVAGLRVLVLLLLGLGPWLRPALGTFTRRSLSVAVLATAYVLLEIGCAGSAVVGELPSAAAAFGPALLFGGVGAFRWWRCDHGA